MGVIDVSFLNKNLRKSSAKDYGFLIDQLEIKQNELESDGKLSAGDFDLLTREYQKLYSHPGLSQEQRSNIDVKISALQRRKSVDALSESSDIQRLNREVRDDLSKINMRFGNDPKTYLNAKSVLLNAKIDRLSDSINSLENSGADASAHYNELNSALLEYQDALQALDDSENYSPGSAPQSNYAAYVVTNSQGEIVDMKIDRIGAQSGYVETNGIYGGFQVYGKVNRKEFGKNVFVLGNKTFSANDVVIPGPDGSLRPSILISSDKQKRGGGFTIAESGYSDIDPVAVRTQSAIRSGGWIEGEKGFLYQKQSDGTYKKFVNHDKTKLGITDNDIIRVPRSYEQNILKDVSETIDASSMPATPLPSVFEPASSAPSTPTGFTPQQPTQPTTLGAGRARTGGPIERSPLEAGSLASRTLQSAGGFLSRLFGGGQ